MGWLTDRRCFALAVAFYGLSALYSIFLWKRGFSRANRLNYLLLCAGFVLHTAAMFKRGLSFSRCPVNNIYEATVFLSWTIVAAYLVLGAWNRLRFLGAFISPLLFALGVFALMPQLDLRGPQPEFSHGLSSLHAALSLLAYGAFGLSSAAALMYLTQEHDLKFHKLRAVISLLPPIERLELTVGRLLLAGFILLTAGLAVGGYYLRVTRGTFYLPDFKINWSLFVWFVYLGLIVMRWGFGGGGRRFAWGAVALFLFIVLTFWGANLISPIHQQ